MFYFFVGAKRDFLTAAADPGLAALDRAVKGREKGTCQTKKWDNCSENTLLTLTRRHRSTKTFLFSDALARQTLADAKLTV